MKYGARFIWGKLGVVRDVNLCVVHFGDLSGNGQTEAAAVVLCAEYAVEWFKHFFTLIHRYSRAVVQHGHMCGALEHHDAHR